MRVDIHTHLWPPALTPPPFAHYLSARGVDLSAALTADGLLASMDEARIDVSVVVAMSLGADLATGELEPLNDFVRDAAAGSAGRLIPYCTVNPLEGPAATRSLRRLIEDRGFQGLKLHSSIQEFDVSDRRVYPVYELMQVYGLPVIFHSGGIGLAPYRDAFGRPARFDDVACAFPELTIVLGHAGRNWYDEMAMLLRKHANVYADISTNFGRDERSRLAPMERLFTSVRGWAGTTDHLLLGSDYPLYGQRATVEGLERLRDLLRRDGGMVTPDEVTRVIDVNAATLVSAEQQASCRAGGPGTVASARSGKGVVAAAER